MRRYRLAARGAELVADRGGARLDGEVPAGSARAAPPPEVDPQLAALEGLRLADRALEVGSVPGPCPRRCRSARRAPPGGSRSSGWRGASSSASPWWCARSVRRLVAALVVVSAGEPEDRRRDQEDEDGSAHKGERVPWPVGAGRPRGALPAATPPDPGVIGCTSARRGAHSWCGTPPPAGWDRAPAPRHRCKRADERGARQHPELLVLERPQVLRPDLRAGPPRLRYRGALAHAHRGGSPDSGHGAVFWPAGGMSRPQRQGRRPSRRLLYRGSRRLIQRLQHPRQVGFLVMSTCRALEPSQRR